MRFTDAIEAFVADWRRLGHMNSPRTEVSYRSRLTVHAEDVGNRDPAGSAAPRPRRYRCPA